ncbi:NAD-dependent epimerase/dehydratase family protein [Parachitinimonas caeni]|uniref:NAD-dependent epimerase/dehydratase family protein n=1 Tax=Parachitinimonas caeni TaxID=3031301 RepID=A0ABT7DS85_9NEIS|nr:NAD-dependent epimerase/dehydratase family protein [Parachitinimonas caeni]MDK2122930.1 NAD-dependent epimerase/dehydratase family protein [Parachitinimonas caeni]
MNPNSKIIVTGAAGLVGQNLVLLLRERGYTNLVAIDKHGPNLKVLRDLNPGVRVVEADLLDSGSWEAEFEGAEVVVQLHAQITGLGNAIFARNNVEATGKVLEVIRRQPVQPFLVHISSSVVNSVADDDYTNTKKDQEKLVAASGLAHCTLRPTLMFGWFDPKHFGWLSRFMEKAPVFPIPGHGRYMRQPLYNRDFCRVIIHCIENQPKGAVYDIVGQERVDYVDIIHAIRKAKQLKTPIVHIPYGLFYALLKVYALFSKQPPFTASQLKALTAGDDFSGVDIKALFDITPTPFDVAIKETFTDPRYCAIALER